MSTETSEVARVLDAHRLDVPTWPERRVGYCTCGIQFPNSAEFAAHQADELAKAGLLRPQEAAQAPQDGANGGDVGSGRGEGVSTPQTGAQAPGEGEA